MALLHDSSPIRFLSFLFLCEIVTHFVGLVTASISAVELGNAKLKNGIFLHHEVSLVILAILFTVLCLSFGLWISGTVKFSQFHVSICRGAFKNRVPKATNGSWKSNGLLNICDCCCGEKSTHRRLPNGDLGEKHENQQLAVSQPSTSMMEQLVPEITHHMLSYLDYRGLCNVSMTNLAMRRAANDDSAWKALFHKDFTVEQSSIATPNGWKAHYAVTKAVMETNRSFYKSFCAKSLRGMSRTWLHADYVKCIHPGGEIVSGYDAVMEQWRTVFNWNQKLDFELHDERVRVVGDMAWVTLKEFVNSSVEPLLATNIYELHEGHWCMVHRHSSPQQRQPMFEYGWFG